MEIKHGSLNTEEQYEGIPNHAVKGSHAVVVDLVMQNVTNNGSRNCSVRIGSFI